MGRFTLTTEHLDRSGRTDVTHELQALIDEVASEKGQLLFAKGTYLLNEVSGLFVHGSNTLLDILDPEGPLPILKRGPDLGRFHRLLTVGDGQAVYRDDSKRSFTGGKFATIRNLKFDGSLYEQVNFNGKSGISVGAQSLIFAGRTDPYSE
ncbi:MAG: hypothetical protein AAF570_18490, partial [Bacteroidota bacterium]